MSQEEPVANGGTPKRPKVERQSDGAPLSRQQEAELQRLRQQVIDLQAAAVEHEVQLRSEEVIEFWIGNRGTIGSKYKENWFAAPGSAQQLAADANIMQRFGMLLARAELGFEGSPNRPEGLKQLSSILGISNCTPLEPAWFSSPRRLASIVVVLDQFSRHVYRHASRAAKQQHDTSDVSAADSDWPQAADALEAGITHCTALALQLSKRIFDSHADDALETPLFIFTLMPFRHTPSVAHLSFVMERVADRWTKLGVAQTNTSAGAADSADTLTTNAVGTNSARTNIFGILARFQAATKQRLLHLRYEAKAKAAAAANEKAAAFALAAADSEAKSDLGVQYAAVLERGPENCDETNISQHVVFRECAVFFGFPIMSAKSTSMQRGAGDGARLSWSKKRKLEKKRLKMQKKAERGASPVQPRQQNLKSQPLHAMQEGYSNGTLGSSEVQETLSTTSKQHPSTEFDPARGPDAGVGKKVKVNAGASTTSAGPLQQIIISLSGGVDSMVICKCLTVLRDMQRTSVAEPDNLSSGGCGATGSVDHGRTGGIQIIAVHIDYGNRSESSAEAAFLQEWCTRLGITFILRRIDEVRRAGGQTSRADYERITRDIRFATYRRALSQFPHAKGIVFGHHEGDIQENVLSNVMRGSSALELAGMAPRSEISGVMIWRPLFNLTKDPVLQFAHAFGVPYFKDTTPLWSTRGKLRTRLLPLLQEIYGEGVLANLTHLAHESTSLGQLVHKVVMQPFLSNVQLSGLCISARWLDFAHYDIHFWKIAFRHLCHTVGVSMVRTKALVQFLNRLERFKADVVKESSDLHNGTLRRRKYRWVPLGRQQRTLVSRAGTLRSCMRPNECGGPRFRCH
eukprot:INCI6999.2.p1 GENE.INCI6999.2~~INCI6999.2.p1  ORF type:complete len:891 (-),score=151.00 INCI6999.2:923-3496(-)